MRRIYRYAGDGTDATGNVLRLVITAFAQTSRMQGHWYNQVDFIEEIRVLHLYCRLASELKTDLGLIGIFHPMNHVPYRVPFIEKQEGRSFIQMHRLGGHRDLMRLPQDGHFCAILPVLCRLGAR